MPNSNFYAFPYSYIWLLAKLSLHKDNTLFKLTCTNKCAQFAFLKTFTLPNPDLENDYLVVRDNAKTYILLTNIWTKELYSAWKKEFESIDSTEHT